MATSVGFEDNFIQFSSSLYDVLDKTDSVCVSPYSVTAALLLLMLGARGGSEKEIRSALFKNDNSIPENVILKKYKSLNDGIIARAGNDVTLALANRLFVSNRFTVLTTVKNKAKQYFGADISIQDFTKPTISAAVMNQWVSKQTKNKINNLIKKKWLNRFTVMFIINAVYFKATWVDQFDPKKTTKKDFYVSTTSTIKKDMMNLRTYAYHKNGETFSALSLPFIGGNFEMVFILPHDKDGLPNLESMLQKSTLSLKSMMNDATNTLVDISIPKFTVQSEIDLKKVLPKLGVHEIFDDMKANFSRLIVESQKDIYVKYAVHKVFLNINEAGAEGAAATAAGVFIKSSAVPFIADHPFLFCIRDKTTGIVLFFGRFQPTA